MSEKEIIEGNRLIGIFLGMEYVNDAPSDYPEGYYVSEDNELAYYLPYSIEDWEFYLSWDWLMPVIERISNQCEEPEELDNLKYALLTNNIDEAYKFVVDYIKDKS